MPRQLHLEGPALQPLLQRARAEHGPAVVVVGAHRVRRGGFAGFFAREHYEVTVQVPDPTRDAPAAAPAARAAAGAVRSAGTSAVPASAPVRVASWATAPASRGASSVASRPASPPAPRAASRPVTAGATTLEDLLALADRSDAAPAVSVSTSVAAPAPSPAPALAPAPAAAAAPSPAAEPVPEAVPARLPGRSLSTESRGFDEVLAALRADLLGADPTDAVASGEAGVLDLAAHHDVADRVDVREAGRPGDHEVPAARSWRPPTVLPDPEPADPEPAPEGTATGADVEPSPALTAVEPAPAESTPPVTAPVHGATPVAEAPVEAEAAVAEVAVAEVPVGHALDLALLADLAREVGASPGLAAAAVADVAASGVTALRHALPLLAASLVTVVGGPAGHPDGVGPGHDPADPVDEHLLARAGDVVVVVAAPHRAEAVAADVARALGTPWLAAWSDEPGDASGAGDTLVLDAAALPPLAARARATGQPVVLALPDPTLADGVAAARAGTGRQALLAALDPELVVLAVDADSSARRQQAVTARVEQTVHGLRRTLALALVGCDRSAAPLAHAGGPVALLDGRPATAGAWTGVVLDALRSAAAR